MTVGSKSRTYFAEDRSGSTPKTLPEGTTGVLLVDGYSGYNVVDEVSTRRPAACQRRRNQSAPLANDVAQRQSCELLPLDTPFHEPHWEHPWRGVVRRSSVEGGSPWINSFGIFAMAAGACFRRCCSAP
jgi:hypothetical protein